MNKKFTKLMAALALLTFLAVPMGMWGQVVSGITYETSSITTFPTEWSYNGEFTTNISDNYLKLISSGNYIQTSSFVQDGFSEITIKARTFGGPSDAQKLITVSWYDATTSGETVLGTVSPTSKTLTDYTISSPSNPTRNTEGYIKIQCKGASSNKGSGVSHVTITYTAGTSNPTYTLTDGSGTNGSISFVPASPVEEGTHVTLTPMPSEAYYFVENSWSFFNDDLDEVTEDIVFVEGEANTIVMPAYNLTVDASFAAKPTYAIICVSNNESWGVLSASPTSAYQGKTVTLSYLPETGYRLSSIAITKKEDGSATGITPVESGDGFTFEMPNYAVTATATFEAIPTYTINFNAGTGNCNTTSITNYEGSTITLPTAEPSAACASRGYVFAGWAEASVSETTTTPTLLNGDYTITADDTLYAVYQVTEDVNTISDVVLANGNYDSNNNIITWTESYVTIVQSKGTSSNFGNYVSSPRWYVDNVVTITPISTVINSIVIEQSSNDHNGLIYSNTTYENASVTANGNTANITPTDGAQAITIVLKKQSRPTSISINYSSGTTTYNSNPECVMRYGLTLPINAEVHLFDGNEIEIETENGTALIEGGTEVRVSIDHVADCQLFESLSINPESGTVTVNEIGTGYYSFTMPSCNASIVVSTTSATQYTLNIVKPDEVSIGGLLVGWDSEVITEFPASICEQASVLIDGLSVSSGYFLKSVTLGDETIELNKEIGAYVFTMPAASATLTFEVRDAASYTLVTSTEQLVPGKHYIIASSKEAGNAKAMSYDRGNNRYAEDVTVSSQNNKTSISEVNGLYEFAISGNMDNWTMYDKNEKEYNGNGTYGYLHTSSSGNNLKTNLNLNTVGDKGYWTISFDAEDGNAIITAKEGSSKIVRFNSSNNIFSCYGSGQQNVYLYVKNGDTNYDFYSNTTTSAAIASGETYTVHSPATLTLNNLNNGSLIIEEGGQLITSIVVAGTVQKNITAYTSDNDGWNLISSPVNNPLGASEIGLTTGTYDLYYLDEPTTKWINYKSSNGNSFSIQPQTGYLYANAANTTLSFSGTLQPNVEEIGCTVPLSKSGNGWNLVGNPFPFNAYVNKPYYVINGRTVEVYEGSDPVPTCTGIIVKATEANETVTFRRTAFTDGAVNNGNIQMTLAQQATNRGTAATVDNAIVSFNEGSQLEKFYFGTQNANLYIPQGTEEYAIASSNGQGEMPVNFKANEDGQYTLMVNPEGVEMGYLHLIDNMTGADIDLLALRQAQGPASYTFNAKTTDYESRFRLVFAANSNNEDGVSTGSTTFAFFSNGSWIINNPSTGSGTGEATLQVIDINGRILSSETINGSVSKSINATTGIYMMRLISGDNVKTQKVVVR